MAKLPVLPQDSAGASRHVLTIDEMVRAPTVAATEDPPPQTPNQPILTIQSAEHPELEIEQVSPGQWSVHIKPPSARVLIGPPVRLFEKLSPRELNKFAHEYPRVAGSQPKWIAKSYLPRIIPRPLPLFNFDGGIKAGNHEGALLTAGLVLAELAERNWPWCTIGTVIANGSSGGTQMGSGVLVGPNLILTASHAVPWDATGAWSMQFIPANNTNLPNPAPFGSAWVEQVRGVLTRENDVNAEDYVIAKLYTPIGNMVGWMGSLAFGDDNIYKRSSWMSVGYPGGLGAPFLAPEIKIVDVDSGGDGRELETGVFLLPGWSGGPLFGFFGEDPLVLGIASGNETEFSLGWFHVTEDHSVFAGGRHMVDLVKYGYANWPI